MDNTFMLALLLALVVLVPLALLIVIYELHN